MENPRKSRPWVVWAVLALLFLVFLFPFEFASWVIFGDFGPLAKIGLGMLLCWLGPPFACLIRGLIDFQRRSFHEIARNMIFALSWPRIPFALCSSFLESERKRITEEGQA